MVTVKDHRLPVLGLSAVCAFVLVVASLDDAEAGPPGLPTDVTMPSTDAGVEIAPPRQFSPKKIQCPVESKTLLINNTRDSDQNPSSLAVRIGSARVKAFPVAQKNGIRIEAGQIFTWDTANGAVWVISEGAADAGVSLGVLCMYGGTP